MFHSPVRVTDKEGNTQNLYSYDAYGKIQREQESIPMPFGYTGYLKETCKDLYYTGSREYNPLSGTFHSKDMYRYMDTYDPLSMNLYAYVKSNPLRYLDFDGHECIEEKDYRKLFADRMALMTCTDGTLGAGLGINLWLSVFGPDLPMDTSDVVSYYAKNFSPQQLYWWLTMGGTEASYMRLLKLEENSKQLNGTGDRVVLPQNTYSLEEIEAEIETGIKSYWSQDEYFSNGWWQDKGKKEEALNMLLLETLLTGEEAGGYDLMQHYTESEPGNPKRYALQMLFQLEPIDGDDEIVLNNIAGACARENIDLAGNGWVIPTQVMQLHAEKHEELQVQADMNENRIMSFALNFTPVVGEVKSVVEAAMGQDIFTGEKLSWVERVLGVATWFVDVANFGKLGKGLKYTDEVLDTAETAGKLGKEVVLENADEVASTVTMAKREVGEVLTEELDEVVASTAYQVDSNANAFDYYMDLVETLDVSTKSNTATFYSGEGNRALAEEFAKINGKTTLETTPGGAYLDDLKLFEAHSPLTNEEARAVWAKLSARYAQNASGNAYGFVNGSWPTSIFNTVEYPELLKNPNITNIFTEFMN